ncbi:MAG: ABC transporter ATPase [Bacteroidota bacterium]
MYIPFQEIPPTARLWVYQADRNLEKSEIENIKEDLKLFITQWTAHQQTLKASAEVFYQRFIILSVDESLNAASGCSIDASVHFLKQLEQKYELNLFDRSQILYLEEDTLRTSSLKDLKQAIAEGKITQDTYIFNNSVSDREGFDKNWKQKAEASWMARYF